MKVLIAEFMDAHAVNALRSRFDTLYDPQLVDRRPEFLKRLGDADAVIVRNRTRVDRALLGFEADSFFVEQGNRPRIGQAFLVIDPVRLPAASAISSASRRSSQRCSRTPVCGCPARDGSSCARARSAKASRFPMRCSRN
jgi:hypothetical protein